MTPGRTPGPRDRPSPAPSASDVVVVGGGEVPALQTMRSLGLRIVRPGTVRETRSLVNGTMRPAVLLIRPPARAAARALGRLRLVGRVVIHLAHARAAAPRRLPVADDTVLDLDARALRRRGRLIHLRPVESRLLEELARSPGRPLSRDWLMERAWPSPPPAGPLREAPRGTSPGSPPVNRAFTRRARDVHHALRR